MKYREYLLPNFFFPDEEEEEENRQIKGHFPPQGR